MKAAVRPRGCWAIPDVLVRHAERDDMTVAPDVLVRCGPENKNVAPIDDPLIVVGGMNENERETTTMKIHQLLLHLRHPRMKMKKNHNVQRIILRNGGNKYVKMIIIENPQKFKIRPSKL